MASCALFYRQTLGHALKERKAGKKTNKNKLLYFYKKKKV